MKTKLFTYAIIWHPNEKEAKEGSKSKIVVAPTHILAVDQNSAQLQAAVQIPDEYKVCLEQLDIAIRPF
jgi:hypothetical protein